MKAKTDTPFGNETRDQTWLRLTQGYTQRSPEWDVLIIGGGITGAGILSEAARRGLSSALIEQRDFAWGTSSRSSKMVHGGLRYLLTGHLKLTRQSVRERERLLREAPGLVEPMGFLYPFYRGNWPERWSFTALLSFYDLLARRSNHRYYAARDLLMLVPRIAAHGLKGGIRYEDAVTDDGRLVLRTIHEAQQHGALALNYAAADRLMISGDRVCGVVIRDVLTGETAEVRARAVVNATGAWVDRLRAQVDGEKHIRPLRGSHLVFPFWRFPIAQAVTMLHPADRRPVILMPWEGATLLGTTDLDHEEDLDIEASITSQEVEYLLQAADYQFPSLGISHEDILATYSGVRPVIGTGALNPSSEKRDHSIWVEHGLISVSGGKLTTFRLIALDVLSRVARFIPSVTVRNSGDRLLSTPEYQGPGLERLDPALRRRLAGRYGSEAENVVGCAGDDELARVPGTDTMWAELRWAARSEAVVHLDDLLLRRTPIGVLLPQGGLRFFDRIQEICKEELQWDPDRWSQEAQAYGILWRSCYSLPEVVFKPQAPGQIPVPAVD
jgi:glycerol-3-phosphate dehydrogenase